MNSHVVRLVEILSRHAELQALLPVRQGTVIRQLQIEKREYYRVLRQIRNAAKKAKP